MTTTQAAPIPTQARPNYWLGFLFNWLAPGSGFTYINKPLWHLGWFGINLGASILSFIIMIATSDLGAPLAALAGLAALVVMMVQYRNTYAAQAASQFTPAFNEGAKWALVLAHVIVVNFIFVGMFAAVLIPNLLGARNAAMDKARLAQAVNIYKAVLAMDAEEQYKPGDCMSTTGSYLTPDQVPHLRSCVTEITPDGELRVTATMDNGQVISLP